MKLKPLCFIAARGGSKGVPGKNLREIGGRPLIAHTVRKALKSKIFSYVVVSTEDKKIAKIAKENGAEVPFMRPKYLATDNATTIDVILHTIKKLEHMNYKFDVIVNLDVTVPFLRMKDVKGAVEGVLTVAAEQMKKAGSFKLAGMLNLKLKVRPATPARKGVNPFTKEPCVFKAKPASKTVKAIPMKKLKEMVN